MLVLKKSTFFGVFFNWGLMGYPSIYIMLRVIQKKRGFYDDQKL